MIKPEFQALLDRQGYVYLAGDWFTSGDYLASVTNDKISFVRFQMTVEGRYSSFNTSMLLDSGCISGHSKDCQGKCFTTYLTVKKLERLRK